VIAPPAARYPGRCDRGFTISQLAILRRILAEGPATAASLAAAEHLSRQAMAQSVAILKAAGPV
jgi:DNA-binding MarR family transcriptional regulator